MDAEKMALLENYDSLTPALRQKLINDAHVMAATQLILMPEGESA